VKERKLIRHILNDNVIGNNVALEPESQSLTQFLVGVDPNIVRCGKQKEMRIEMTFGIKHA
jgi:hypothetical protein